MGGRGLVEVIAASTFTLYQSLVDIDDVLVVIAICDLRQH